MKIINLKLSDWQHKLLKKTALDADESMQAYIEWAVSERIKKETGEDFCDPEHNIANEI